MLPLCLSANVPSAEEGPAKHHTSQNHCPVLTFYAEPLLQYDPIVQLFVWPLQGPRCTYMHLAQQRQIHNHTAFIVENIGLSLAACQLDTPITTMQNSWAIYFILFYFIETTTYLFSPVSISNKIMTIDCPRLPKLYTHRPVFLN